MIIKTQVKLKKTQKKEKKRYILVSLVAFFLETLIKEPCILCWFLPATTFPIGLKLKSSAGQENTIQTVKLPHISFPSVPASLFC